MKFTNKQQPVYIQPPKCSIKQGFFKSGKRMYCDLVFSIEDTIFIEWLEQLQQKSVETIYANRSKWFDTELDESDIENTMTSPYKMYKAGKMFIVRTGVLSTLGKIDLKIYDEDENELNHEDLKDGTQVMVILEFKGIKCSARSFQFEIEMKQMLVSKPTQLFQHCLLKKKESVSYPEIRPVNLAKLETNIVIPPEPIEIDHSQEPEETRLHSLDPDPVPEPDPIIETTDIQPQFGIVELDLDYEEEGEPIQLKNRKDVYYKMYREARQKAREAKIAALTNYLEAKRIKNTYFLDDLSDDSDLDEFIDVNEE